MGRRRSLIADERLLTGVPIHLHLPRERRTHRRGLGDAHAPPAGHQLALPQRQAKVRH